MRKYIMLIFFFIFLGLNNGGKAQDCPINLEETIENQGVTDRYLDSFVLGENEFEDIEDFDSRFPEIYGEDGFARDRDQHHEFPSEIDFQDQEQLLNK